MEDLDALELPRLVIREIRRTILKVQEPGATPGSGNLG